MQAKRMMSWNTYQYFKLKQKEINNFSTPSLDILDSNEPVKNNKKKLENIEQSSELLEKVFADFNIEIKVINVKLGPVVTLFEILPAAGTKINTDHQFSRRYFS
jgi:S-DNA-T family DNA segregation ATPase FtsK/SpoIIIE